MKKKVRNIIYKKALKRYQNKGWVKSIIEKTAPMPVDFDSNQPELDDFVDAIIEYLESKT